MEFTPEQPISVESLRPSFAFIEERLAQLRDVVPEAFADGKVNWQALREALGEWLEPEEPDTEHYGLTWPGKREARQLASLPSRKTLIPAPGEGIDELSTHNVFIEAENLEALKLLQKSYGGRVKMIYIDPPYNTGNDFIYRDDFFDSLGYYRIKAGQVDEEGHRKTTNARIGGRFHSNWLSMMYPRLLLARPLLREDGVIFVSIDDNEVAELRLLLDEVFGEENFVANVVWQKRTSPDARLNLAPAHDHVLVYARTLATAKGVLNLLPLTAERTAAYKNPDNDPRGPWASVDLTGQTGHATASQYYTIVTPNGTEHPPPRGRCWALAEATFEQLRRDNRIWFGADGDARPRLKKFLSESAGTTTSTWWPHTDAGSNQEGTREVAELLGSGDVFTNPKPIKLLRRMLQLATRPSEADVVLDFFAGSASTAHAVMELNREDGGNRRSISVQLPEPVEKQPYQTIADISIARLRAAIRKLQTANGDVVSDLGFRVYKLAPSNFRAWQDYDGTDVAELESLFSRSETPLVDLWSATGLLTEVILLEGFPLDSIVTERRPERKQRVFTVESPQIGHRLICCFDERVDPTVLDVIELRTDDVLVCLDSALTDRAKLRLADRCTLRTI